MPQMLLDVASCLDDKIMKKEKPTCAIYYQTLRLIKEPCELVKSTPYLCTCYYVCSYSWILTWEIQICNN
jgi:hypothetical protein